ncbi:MAG TPA: sensor histidine kinase [Kineosporiaceae bacterium]|nr:sensor histidine kinase [Kineosporiaceae bacterium]
MRSNRKGAHRVKTPSRVSLRVQLPPSRTLASALTGIGLALSSVSIAMELTDAEPRFQLWVSAVAGAAFLIAIPLVHGGEDQVLTGRARLLVGAGCTAVLAVIGLWRATDRAQPAVLLLLVPALLLFVTAVVAIREAGRTSHARRVSQLRSRFQGQESERRRWAQELHDQTLQDLAAIELRLASLANTQDSQALAAGVQEARGMVREQIRVLRHLITQMRPLALDTLGLAAAVQDLARRSDGSGDGLPTEPGAVRITCDVTALPLDLAPDVQVAIYRIIQEALSNALHHAACSTITVTAAMVGSDLEVTIQDDGIGLSATDSPPDSKPPSFGRLGMKERADAIAGQLTWSTPAEGGTLVRLRVSARYAESGSDAERLEER